MLNDIQMMPVEISLLTAKTYQNLNDFLSVVSST